MAAFLAGDAASTTPAAFFVGILGDCTSLFLILAPLPAFNTVRINQAVGELSPYPFLVALFNCCIWVLYAAVHDNSGPVLAINLVGIAFELGYVVCFLKYADDDASEKPIITLVVELFMVGVVAALGYGLGVAPATFGYVGVASAIGMYATPLCITYTAYQAEDVERMTPIMMVVAMLANAVCWFIYGLIVEDKFVWVSNLVGVVSAVAQLAVYFKLKG